MAAGRFVYQTDPLPAVEFLSSISAPGFIIYDKFFSLEFHADKSA
jgi:hypothetical protein